METCRACQFSTAACVCGHAANDNCQFDPGFIRVPSDAELAKPSARHRLATIFWTKKISRRSVLDYMTDAFVQFNGVAVDSTLRRIDVTDIDVDQVFRTDADPSERWLSDFLRAALAMPERGAQDRVIPRLRLLWLALAITNRQQAELVVM